MHRGRALLLPYPLTDLEQRPLPRTPLLFNLPCICHSRSKGQEARGRVERGI